MTNQPTDHQKLDSLLTKTLQVLQDPFYLHGGPHYETIASLLSNLQFFHNNFPNSSHLKHFLELARWHVNYEVHDYGTILYKEQDYVEKLYIIVNGKVNRLQQRSFQEVESEIQLTSRSKIDARSSLMIPSMTINDLAVKGERFNGGKDLGLSSIQSLQVADDETSVESSRFGSMKLFSRTKILKDKTPVTTRKNSIKLEGSATDNVFLTTDRSVLNRRGGSKSKVSSPVLASKFTLGTRKSEQKDDFLVGKSSTLLVRHTKSKSNVQVPEIDLLRIYEEEGKRRNSKEEAILELDMEGGKDEAREEDDEGEEESSAQRTGRNCLAFVRNLSRKNPVIEGRCFLHGVLKVFISNVYSAGDIFGENFCKQGVPKESGIIAVASEKVHLLSISRKNYFDILAKIADLTNVKSKFFCQALPSFQAEVAVKFSRYFTEKCYQKGEMIYEQHDNVQGLYFIFSGEAIVSKENTENSLFDTIARQKNITPSNLKTPKKLMIPIATMREKQFFGEEMLTGGKKRLFSVMANLPNTRLFYLDVRQYEGIKDFFVDIFTHLKSQVKEKVVWRRERVTELLDAKKLDWVKLKIQTSPTSMVHTPKEKSPVISEDNTPRPRPQLEWDSITKRASWSEFKVNSRRSKILVPKPYVEPSDSLRSSTILKSEAAESPLRKRKDVAARRTAEEISLQTFMNFNLRKDLALERPMSNTTRTRPGTAKLTLSPSQSPSRASRVWSPRVSSPSISVRTHVNVNTNEEEKTKTGFLSLTRKKSMPTLSAAQKLAKYSYLQTRQLVDSPKVPKKSLQMNLMHLAEESLLSLPEKKKEVSDVLRLGLGLGLGLISSPQSSGTLGQVFKRKIHLRKKKKKQED